jgi:dTDP-4-amino-4,6-dideoxygalactose transaminase
MNTGVYNYAANGDVSGRRNLEFMKRRLLDDKRISQHLPKSGDLMDVGCGNGRLWKLLKPHFRHVVGVDPFVEPDERFRYIGCYFAPIGIQDWHDNSAAFDVVMFNQTLYVMPDKVGALTVAKNVMKDTGAILIVEDAKRVKDGLEGKMFSPDNNLVYDILYLSEQLGLEVLERFVEEETAFIVLRKKPTNEYITFGKPCIGEVEMWDVVDSMRSGWIGTGPKVRLFSEMFRNYIGAKHAIPVGSCTAGLFLSLKAMGIGKGDAVVTTPLTFASTVNVIEHVGAVPCFVDVDPETGLMDLEQVKANLKATSLYKAIMPVHLYGRPVNIPRLDMLASEYDLKVIEDAAHAIEASHGMHKIGLSHYPTCFSFYVTKNMTTCEGGMVTCGDDEMAERIRSMSHHGLDKDAWRRYSDSGYKHYAVVEAGYKFNMTDLQAAIGIHQLAELENRHERRAEIWQTYMEGFKDTPLALPKAAPPSVRHALHLFTVLIDPETCRVDRDSLMEHLHRRGIGSGVHYIPVHCHPYYREKYNYKPDDFPNANRIGQQTLSLPLAANLTDKQVQRVIDCVKEKVRSTTASTRHAACN